MARNIIIILVIALILAVGFVILGPGEEIKEGEISSEEKELIEAWIIENNLNQYGDAKDTVYGGGTPLFDEMTGETVDKYQYILENNPDRPWKK